ncbi:hypothetical protein [Brevundimonas sp.]|uniref:hypothetical protein n=1 Tax=Brevundimonas sp. TaxID=1871086 RepID=UPI003D6CF463
MISGSVRNTLMAAAVAMGALTLAGQASAQAKCNLTLDPGADQWIIRYNPLEDDAAVRDFDLALVNTGKTPCNGRFNVSLRGEPFGLGAPGTSVRVPYAMRDQRSGADLTPRSGTSENVTGAQIHVPKEGREMARIRVAVQPPANLAYGRYTQTAYIALRAANGEVHAERPVTLVLETAAAAVIGLKGEFTRQNGIPTISLGELSQGTRALNTSVYVHSTAGYRVSVTSQNLGKLRQAGTAWYIDYGLQLGARNVNLTAPYSFDVVSAQARNDDYPLTVRIGDTAGKRAGDYSDILTFTVAAL